MLTFAPALPSPNASTLKRHVPQEFNDVDSENIDPLFFLSSKKTKGFDFDNSKLEKAPRFTLAAPTSIKNIELPQSVGCKRKADDFTSTSVIHSKRRAEPVTAPPAPTGRSPKHKRIGILQRRRATGNSITRINPPGASSNAPFSLNAALAGTISMKSKTKSSKKGYDFEIYEDSEVEHNANLMQHGACNLEISDDESRMSPSKGDRDNKENVPPSDYNTAANAPVMRRDVMTDDIRSPLGDLDAKDFYAEGCDAHSAFIVPFEEPERDEKTTLETPTEDLSPPHPVNQSEVQGQQGWEDILAQISAKQDGALSIETGSASEVKEPDPIKIWESESAKGEEEISEAVAS